MPNITKRPIRTAGLGASEVACGKGRAGSMTKAGGLGKQMVANLDGVMKNYKEQVTADRRAATLDRLAGF